MDALRLLNGHGVPMGNLKQVERATSPQQVASVVLMAAGSLVVSLGVIDYLMRNHYYKGLAAERPGDGAGPAAPEDSSAVSS